MERFAEEPVHPGTKVDTADTMGGPVEVPAGHHHLWQKHSNGGEGGKEQRQIYKLRISVLRDGQAVGGVDLKTYEFPSLHHLTHATNELTTAFSASDSTNITLKKCGLEAPNSEVEIGRGLEGFVENVSVEYESVGQGGDSAGWAACLEKLKALDNEWTGEGRSMEEAEKPKTVQEKPKVYSFGAL